MDEKYYRLLKKDYVSREAILTEIINLSAICELPKGTEHFVSDVHGEYFAFNHVLRNGSGSIREKICDCFPEMSSDEITDLAVLIYYPNEKLELVIIDKDLSELTAWYRIKIVQLLQVTQLVGGKYTRSKVRKALPESFRYIIEELLEESDNHTDKKDYFESIIDNIISLHQADELITVLANTIRRLVVDHLHVVGDIYDRGPYPDLIMDRLMALPSVDIQWGNHDIVWMAILAGSPLAMMNVIRICARYGNLNIIEDRYGISLRPIISYARKYYCPTTAFEPLLSIDEGQLVSAEEKIVLNILQQAASILQFKLESQLIARRPELHLQHRDVLNQINYDTQEITLADVSYPLTDFQVPTIDPKNPSALTDEEAQLLEKLLISFYSSEKLHRHVDFLLEKGGMYLCYNDNLLIHGCLPLYENGDFESLRVKDKMYSGKALLDFFEQQVRKSFENPEISDDFSTDILWYLWMGECSSLFGKYAMTTFERYYINDKKTHEEKKNAYYNLRDNEIIVKKILKEFRLPENGHIINGHTPVKEKFGENPIKAHGKLIVIDGGFSKPYRKETGIAGYTLLYNSYGIQLVAHQPFTSVEEAVNQGTDIVSTKRLVDKASKRVKVKNTNVGKQLQKEIEDLKYLFKHYSDY